jgi:hypothetical protein
MPRGGTPGYRDGFGTILTDTLHLEVMALPTKDGVLLHVRLRDDQQPKLRCLTCDETLLDLATNALETKPHDLLGDPTRLFSEQSERCCCCHKALSDPVSRTRGIGPECIRYFQTFLLKPPPRVEEYRHHAREQYLQDTGFLPGL